MQSKPLPVGAKPKHRHSLVLDPDIVDIICRLMQRPEMHGITGIGLLKKRRT